ncbi:MAG: ferritin [Phycisphaerae bacterium]|jgi:ferritin
MLNTKVQEAFNKQLNVELFSSYLYLSMGAYFESQNLKGMASWMRAQAAEENEHGMKFFGYINDRGGRVLLAKIEEPTTEWASPLAVFEDACKHEHKVTERINKLVELTADEKDYASNTFLHWFVTEQVEEEATVEDIRDRLKRAGDNTVALIMIDRELGMRARTQS